MTRRYAFDEVRAALLKHWGLTLHRGGDWGDGKHDGRWDTSYSKIGYVVGGHLPGIGHGYRRFKSLRDVVRASDLEGHRRAAQEGSGSMTEVSTNDLAKRLVGEAIMIVVAPREIDPSGSIH